MLCFGSVDVKKLLNIGNVTGGFLLVYDFFDHLSLLFHLQLQQGSLQIQKYMSFRGYTKRIWELIENPV